MAEVFFKTKLAEVEVEQVSNGDAAPANPKAAKGAPTTKASDAIAKLLDEVTKIIVELQDVAAVSLVASEEAQKHAQESLVLTIKFWLLISW